MTQSDLVYRTFHIYRLSLSAFLLGGYLLFESDLVGQAHSPTVFLFTAIIWFITATASSFSTVLSSNKDWLSCVNFIIDVIALAILGWATGGMSGGLFFLMLPSAAMAGLILTPKYSLLVAATASISTLAAQTLLILDQQLPTSVYFPSGVLGIMLFLATTAFSLLSQRLSKTEAASVENEKVAKTFQKLNENIIERMETGVIAVNEQNQIEIYNHAAESLLGSEYYDAQHSSLPQLEDYADLFKSYSSWLTDNSFVPSPILMEDSGITVKASFERVDAIKRSYSLIWLEDMRTIQIRAQHFKYQSLSKLSSGLAHEIRNPLSAIQQANELLLDSENISELDRELTLIIARHSKRMNEIIEVIQQLSKNIEANSMAINLKEWTTGFIFEFAETQQDTAQPNIQLDVPEDLEIYFDPRHLKQILTNLLENALRYGGSEVKQTLKAEMNSSGSLAYIDLFDTGPGIDREKSDNIFNPFFTTSEQGSGLGLYLARELCEANYASINYLYESNADASGYFRITANTTATQN